MGLRGVPHGIIPICDFYYTHLYITQTHTHTPPIREEKGEKRKEKKKEEEKEREDFEDRDLGSSTQAIEAPSIRRGKNTPCSIMYNFVTFMGLYKYTSQEVGFALG